MADLPGHRDGDLPGDLVADLLGDSVADGVGDVPDDVGALGLRDLGADWPLDQALLLDLDITLDSNQLGLLAHLGLDVLALLNDSSLNDGVGLSHAVGAGDGGALLVSDLPDGGGADLLGDGVADIVDLSLVLGVGHGVADALWDGLALLSVLEVIDGLADGVGLDVVGVGPGVAVAVPAAAVATVSAPVAAVVLAVVGLSVGLRLAQGQWCNQAQKYKILIHFAFLKNLKHTSTNGLC